MYQFNNIISKIIKSRLINYKVKVVKKTLFNLAASNYINYIKKPKCFKFKNKFFDFF